MKPLYVVIHHSLTKDQAVVDYAAIRRYHMTEMVMTDIGYHGVVEMAGQGYVPLLGRAWDIEGAHCKQMGMNRFSLGLCLVGNFDGVPPPDDQLEESRDRFLLPWMRMYGIPAQNLHPHRLYATYKTCPGRAFTGALLARFIPGIDLTKWR